VVTASGVEDQSRALGFGAAAALVKPVEREVLLHALAQITARLPGEVRAQGKPNPEDIRPLVLLAEDNDANRRTVGDFLRSQEYDVIVAEDGEEAVTNALAWKPALILMDVQMPRVDGLEAIKRIRAALPIAHVPIVALTALAMPGDKERCLSAGANAYLSKPVSLKELASLVALLTGRPE
jgi:CheY-like chemotaxis protein